MNMPFKRWKIEKRKPTIFQLRRRRRKKNFSQRIKKTRCWWHFKDLEIIIQVTVINYENPSGERV
jgi:hypothetical protein